jgi:enterochelin esterase-like enzyme
VSTTAPFGPRGHQQVEVYLPACYDADPARRYPVVYLLHGASADQTQWRDVGITAAADGLITAGHLPPLVIVMPDGGPAMPDSLAKDLVDGLIPWAEGTYHVSQDAAQRAVGGISRGGRVALAAAAAHPTMFAAVGGHSPAVDHGEDALAARLGKVPGAIRLDAGRSDSLRVGMQRFADEARSAGADVQVAVAPGAHDRAYWRSQASAYLHFYADRWAGPRPPPTSAGAPPG